MRIGIHNEPAGAPGGTEVSVAILADALAKNHAVDVIHHSQSLTVTGLASFAGVPLRGVNLRFVRPLPNFEGSSRLPWRRLTEARGWYGELSAPYDVFVSFGHALPPFCHAPKGILVCLFPMFVPQHRVEYRPAGIRGVAQRLYSQLEWKRRLDSYTHIIAISEFTKTWIESRWGVPAEIVYPPCTLTASTTEKLPIIANVGRFSSKGHGKCQLEMARTFSHLDSSGWSFVLAGSVGSDPDDLRYLAQVESERGERTQIAKNTDRTSISALLSQASIYWHAAGFANSDGSPDRYEHFGMTTVEAMSAGCVPVVFNGGGQRDIVEHGVNGFIWNSLEELKQFTTHLIVDPDLRRKMSLAAIQRAERYSERHYLARMGEIIEAPTVRHPLNGQLAIQPSNVGYTSRQQQS